MLYEYECESCGTISVVSCLMKDMERTHTCDSCGGIARKIVSAPYLTGVTSTRDRIGKEMRKKNEEAGKRCRGSHASQKASGFSFE